MNITNKLFDYKRMGYVVAAFAVLLATALPSLALAAQITERSVELSSSSANADDVTYRVNFTPATSAGAIAIFFCSDSPTLGQACAAPGGFDATGATAGGGFTATGSTNKVVLVGTVTAPTPLSIAVANIDSPSAAGALYARIITFDTQANATAATATANTQTTGYRDHGSVAMYITPTIGVTGSVLETLVFCASAAAIDDNCGGTLTTPNVSLGTNGILGTALSQGTVYSQISTNAATGAVVNLKSSTTGCGGLMRAGETDPAEGCGIGPATNSGAAIAINTGDAKFGLRLDGLANGTGTIAASGNYNTTTYLMNWVTGDATGVTSTYGDPVYNTANEPISNGEANLVFGANIGNDTPAGTYSANLSLIATGKF